MSLCIRPVGLDSFDLLPAHVRQCVFWEIDPSAVPDAGFDSEFDKEAWMSMVMLDWGRCAHMAVESDTNTIVGTAFFAPPGRVPRARLFPTSPVSPDAILLTAIRVLPGWPAAASMLADAVVDDVMRRGARAIEAFGVIGASDDAGHALIGDEVCTDCMIDAQLLTDSGFTVVAPHHRYPRFRLELDQGLSWKSAVETALQELAIHADLAAVGEQRIAISTLVDRGIVQSPHVARVLPMRVGLEPIPLLRATGP